MPLEHHDRNRIGSDDWDNGGYFVADAVTAGQPDDEAEARSTPAEAGFPRTFVDGAARYDMGGRPNVVLYPPLIVGMEWLHEVGGAERIGRTLRPLTRYVRAYQRNQSVGNGVVALRESCASLLGWQPAFAYRAPTY